MPDIRMSYLQECIAFTCGNEGGVANNSHDKGGLTNKGITLNTLREASAKLHGHDFDKNHDGKIDGVDLLLISAEDVEFIVTECGYWTPNLDRLARGIAIKTFDFRFNMGVASGTKILQTAINKAVAKPIAVDGLLGESTVNAANSIDPYHLFSLMATTAMEHYVNIAKVDHSQLEFIRGWTARAKRPPYNDPQFRTAPFVVA